MFCKKCGSKLDENSKFCNSCGAQVDVSNEETKEEPAKHANVEVKKSGDNKKLWKILSYFGILFLIGLFCEDKDDKSVRFHVGQGMLLCISYVAAGIVMGILEVIGFLITIIVVVNVFSTGFGEISAFGNFISFVLRMIPLLVYAAPITLNVIGVMNACKDEDKELPVIGKYAFYK